MLRNKKLPAEVIEIKNTFNSIKEGLRNFWQEPVGVKYYFDSSRSHLSSHIYTKRFFRKNFIMHSHYSDNGYLDIQLNDVNIYKFKGGLDEKIIINQFEKLADKVKEDLIRINNIEIIKYSKDKDELFSLEYNNLTLEELTNSNLPDEMLRTVDFGEIKLQEIPINLIGGDALHIGIPYQSIVNKSQVLNVVNKLIEKSGESIQEVRFPDRFQHEELDIIIDFGDLQTISFTQKGIPKFARDLGLNNISKIRYEDVPNHIYSKSNLPKNKLELRIGDFRIGDCEFGKLRRLCIKRWNFRKGR